MIHDVEHDAIAGPDGVLHRVPDRGVDLRQWPGAAVGVARRDRNPGAGEAGDRRAVWHRAPDARPAKCRPDAAAGTPLPLSSAATMMLVTGLPSVPRASSSACSALSVPEGDNTTSASGRSNRLRIALRTSSAIRVKTGATWPPVRAASSWSKAASAAGSRVPIPCSRSRTTG